MAVVTMAAPACAAEINVVAAGAVRGIIGGMIDDYSQADRTEVQLHRRPDRAIARGASRPASRSTSSSSRRRCWRSSRRAGKITPGSRIDLGRVGLGVVVREGTPSPDISTPEAVKAALIKAKTIAYTDPKLGGTSVEHLMKIAESFGIKDDVIRKGADLDRRQRCRGQGRRRQGRHRHRADHRHPRQGRQARRSAARTDPALDGLFRRDPCEQRRSRSRARVRRGA